MDFSQIEKRLFACIILVSFLVGLIVVFVNSLLSISYSYFLSFGFSEKELALINMAIVGSLIAITALAVVAYIKGVFPKRKTTLQLDTIPKAITSWISEFIKGYNEY